MTEARYGGEPCAGMGEQFRSCKIKECPVDCVIGVWSSYSECSTTCGMGTMFRTRVLTPPRYEGDPCPSGEAAAREEIACNDGFCPVDCHFTEWTEWSDCSQTCDSGLKIRSRTKIDARYGGAECAASEKST